MAHVVKVVLLGDSGVGKTSLANRLLNNEFRTDCAATVGAAFLIKDVPVDGVTLRFHIWDTAGQEKFRSMATMYFRGANAAALVFDITNGESFTHLPDWLNDLKQNVPEDIALVVAGNKIDSGPRAVATDVACTWSTRNAATYVETSAKTGEGTQELFETLARKIIELNGYSRGKDANSVVLGSSGKKKQCC